MVAENSYHRPVLLEETIDAVIKDADGVYVDLTFGGGGHSRRMLDKLSAKGRLIVFDQDEEARANLIDDKRITFVASNFRYLYRYWKWLDESKVDGVLADLGVSSHQFDTDYRGFSFRHDTALDMRMNTQSPVSATTVVNDYSHERLQKMFSRYGEIRNARKLSLAICDARKYTPIETVGQFNKIVETLIVGERKKYLSQVYQSVRIEVNNEIVALEEMLMDTLKIVKQEGRIVMISYHSLEDRLVKRFFRAGNLDGKVEKDDYGRSLSPIKQIGKLVIPDQEEIEINPRARSAKMRVGEIL